MAAAAKNYAKLALKMFYSCSNLFDFFYFVSLIFSAIINFELSHKLITALKFWLFSLDLVGKDKDFDNSKFSLLSISTDDTA